MATFFRSKVLKDVGKVKTPGIVCDASTRSTIIGVSLTNLLQSNIFYVYRNHAKFLFDV